MLPPCPARAVYPKTPFPLFCSVLLEERRATIPHLAEKLTNELVGHIIVSNRSAILSRLC